MKRMLLIAIAIAICYVIVCPLVVLNFAAPLAEKAFPLPLTYLNASEIPENYYNKALAPACTHDTLELLFLLSDIKYPHEYEAGIFDCSESAAFLECHLENLGYDAVIMVGANKSSEGQKYVHAWVEVRNLTVNQSGNLVAMPLDRHEDLTYFSLMGFYYREDRTQYEDIYEACEAYGGCNQWDWWNA